jgi:hypothetical protein
MENRTKDDIYALHEQAANLCKRRNYYCAAFTIQKIVNALSVESVLNEILTRSLLRIYFLCLEQFIKGSYDSAQDIIKNLRIFYSSELRFD